MQADMHQPIFTYIPLKKKKFLLCPLSLVSHYLRITITHSLIPVSLIPVSIPHSLIPVSYILSSLLVSDKRVNLFLVNPSLLEAQVPAAQSSISK